MPRVTPAKPSPAVNASIREPPAKSEPSEEEIRLRAFQIYQARGGAPGNPAQDWELAKSELKSTRAVLTR